MRVWKVMPSRPAQESRVLKSCPAKRPPGLREARIRSQSAGNRAGGHSGRAKLEFTRSQDGHSASSNRATAPSIRAPGGRSSRARSEEHTSELQSLMRISYAVFCLKKKQKMTCIHISSKI